MTRSFNVRVLHLAGVMLSMIITKSKFVYAQCNATNTCPSSTPCCSEYGYCGTGFQYCVGGCNPLGSHTLDSCSPEPICQSATYSFADTSRIFMNGSDFDGNATDYDWTLDKGSIQPGPDNSSIALVLTETNGGTRLSSTRFVNYGSISVTMKTGRWPGVVAAAITMSGIKDEIDLEFVGNDTLLGQSNYFSRGVIPTVTAGENFPIQNDSYTDYNTYSINWTEDQLQWESNGQVVRTLNRSDTYNSATGLYEYPNTPSRVQLSLWAAGINTSAIGTIEWAGGLINWNDPDYIAAGDEFISVVSSVSITCLDPVAPGPNDTSYVYVAGNTTQNPSVVFSNQSTVLQITSSATNGTNGTSGSGTSGTSGSSSSDAASMYIAMSNWPFFIAGIIVFSLFLA